MARINQGILGGLSGKIANVVGGAWKGINYLRSLPVSVSNPRTTPQVAQRNKMTTAVRLSKQILAGFIKPLWDRFAIKQSGYNAWVSENIDNMDDTGIVSTSLAIMSKGVMTAVTPATASYSEAANDIVLTWPTALPDSQSADTDIAYIAVYDEFAQVFNVGKSTGVARSAGTATVELDTVISAGNVGIVYLVFKNVEGTKVSYAGNKGFTAAA